MQKWEYQEIRIPSSELTEKGGRLDSRGAEGWELVAVTESPYKEFDGELWLTFFFKRPLQE